MMQKRQSILIGCLCLLTSARLWAQVVIGASVQMASEGTPDVVIQCPGNFTNNSAVDLSSLKVLLELTGGDQTVKGNLVLTELRVSAGAIKTISNNITITNRLVFTEGILTPVAGSKLLYTGTPDQLSDGNDGAYVNGVFYIRGTGLMKFPVGAPGLGYTPLLLENGDDTETGVQVTHDTPALTPDASAVELAEIDDTHFWTIIHPDLSALASRVQVSLAGTRTFSDGLNPVVVQADETGSRGFSLGGNVTGGAVLSVDPVTKPVIAVGGGSRVEIKIFDLISPFTRDQINDVLYIENISKFPENRVKLLDRYGVLIREWKNFTNFNDPINPNPDTFDFSRLNPGSYICVVEYSNATQGAAKKSQMVTVLKTK